MPKFQYVAMTDKGKEKKGAIEANTEQEAVAKLKAKHLFVTTIKQQMAKTKGGGGFVIGTPKLRHKELVVFTRQMSTLLEAGMPLVRALRTLEKQAQKKPGMHRVLTNVRENVEGGSNLTESLAAHPKSFNRLYVNMVKAGEASGNLEVVLSRLAEFLEKGERIKAKIKSASMYPIIVMVVALLIISGLMIFIVPRFKQIFTDLLGESAQLPALTRFVMTVSEYFANHYLIMGGVFVAIIVLFKVIKNTEAGGYFLDYMLVHTPVIRELPIKSAVSRFARTLATLQKSGVSILQSLQIVKDTTTNRFLARTVQKISDSVTEGEPVAKPMADAKVYPDMVVSMVEVGEETGDLPDMLERVANTYDVEVDGAVDGLISMLEPLMIVMLAIVVGTVVIALFLPMVEIIQGMSAA